MELGHDLLFFFAALGAFNSLLLSVYLLFRKQKHNRTYLLLGLLLLAHAIRAGFSCLYYFDDAPREFIKLGLSANLLIGPTLYYFVVLSLSRSERKFSEALAHIFALVILLFVLGFHYNFQTWDYTFRYSIHIILSLYLTLTGAVLFRFFRSRIKRKTTLEVRKAFIVYLAVLLVCFGFVISLYTNYLLGPLLFSVLFYLFAFLFFRMEPSSRKVLSYQKKLDEEEVKKVVTRLSELMEKEQAYRDPNLTLEKLAKKLTVSKYFLSQMLNDNLNTGYHELITENRIKEASELLLSTEHLTLEAIAYEVGFNSKSSFFSAFKRIKGTTPTKYREQLKV